MSKRQRTYAELARSHDRYMRTMNYAEFKRNYQANVGLASQWVDRLKIMHPRHWLRYRRESGWPDLPRKRKR